MGACKEAEGRSLAGTRAAVACATGLAVAAGVLSSAVPAVATGPIGAQHRVSSVAPDGVPSVTIQRPDVAFDPVNQRSLVVWTDEASPGASEIYGRMLDADGVPLGDTFQISQMGPSPADGFEAVAPVVAYNRLSERFLVVWAGDDERPGLADNENEIYGQLIDGAGNEIGPDDFRISVIGDDGDPDRDAFRPGVVANDGTGEFVAVFRGDQLADQDFEIHARRIAADGSLQGSQVMVSDLFGTDWQAGDPVITFNPVTSQYLVVFHGRESDSGLAVGEAEVFAQLLSPQLVEQGVDDRQITTTPTRGAFRPTVATNTADGTYLVVWDADPQVFQRAEVRGDLLTPEGAPVNGGDGITISAMQPLGVRGPSACEPTVVYRPDRNEYLVAWRGVRLLGTPDTEEACSETNDELEAFGRRMNASGNPLGAQRQISQIGPDGDVRFNMAGRVAMAPVDQGRIQTVWTADGGAAGTAIADGQLEVFARQWGPEPPAPPQSPAAPADGTVDRSPQPSAAQQPPPPPSGETSGPPAAGAPPAAVTGRSVRRRTRSVRIAGSMNPRGRDTVYRVQFGRSRTALASQTPGVTVAPDAGEHRVFVDIKGLRPGTTYHYRLVARNDAGVSQGEVLTVSTWRRNEVRLGLDARAACIGRNCALTQLRTRIQMRNPNTNRAMRGVNARKRLSVRVICRRGCRLNQKVSARKPRAVVKTVVGPGSLFSSRLRTSRGPRARRAAVTIRPRTSRVDATLTQVFTDGRGRRFLLRPGSEIHVQVRYPGYLPAVARIRLRGKTLVRQVCRLQGQRPVGCRRA